MYKSIYMYIQCTYFYYQATSFFEGFPQCDKKIIIINKKGCYFSINKVD